MFWVPMKMFVGARQMSVLTGWDDAHSREERTEVHPSDPIMLSPDYRVDELTSDYRVFFDFLWGRGRLWTQAAANDWRRSPQNPGRVGGAKWNRELAALTRLYEPQNSASTTRCSWTFQSPLKLSDSTCPPSAVAMDCEMEPWIPPLCPHISVPHDSVIFIRPRP